MTKYREETIGGQRLICGDCDEILPIVADLVLTAPPYGVHVCEKRRGFMADRIGQDAAKWDVAPSPELLRKTVSSGKQAIVWGFGYFADTLGKCTAPLVWDKQTGDNYFADGELAWTSFSTGTLRIFRHQWCGCFKASERGIKAEHPTQKPVSLMSWCIDRAKLSAGATVLDPFMGSGTTLMACELAGMNGIGIELNSEYFELACKRVEQAVKQREQSEAQLSLVEA